MAALPVIPNVFRCALNWQAGLQTATNVIHIEDTVGGRTAFDAAVEVASKLTDNMIQTSTNEATIIGVDALPLDGSGSGASSDEGLPVTGLGSNQWTPALCALVKLTTDIRGRRNRGRVYLPFQAESIWDAGQISAAQADAVTTAWGIFLSALNADDWQMVVASYVGAEAHPVQTARCERTAATQRRRQTRVRRSLGD